MKLRNYTLLYLSVSLLIILGIWATLFYINMLDEVYDSIDDGLDNYKMLIIDKAETDSTVVHKNAFAESNYSIRAISREQALQTRDVYRDTLMYMQYEADFEPVRLLTTAFITSEGQPYELKVISSMVEEDDLIEDLLYALLWLYLVIMVTMAIVNTLMIRRIWAPFYETIRQLRNFKLGSRHHFVSPRTKVSEFVALNETIELLLQQNLETYNGQKQFIENAAHELQTPLAISINKLELFAENASLPDAEMEQLGSVLANLERLTKLNKSLLLLSKIGNKQFEAAEQPINLNEIVLRIVSDFEDFANHRLIRIEVDDIETIRPRMAPDLAEMLVVNLLKNALVHNREGGTIHVRMAQNTLEISNTGVPEALDTDKIFTRFYKNAQSSQTTGLGLAIVKAIADACYLRIDYAFEEKHVFSVYF